jgi:hypothetical protein
MRIVGSALYWLTWKRSTDSDTEKSLSGTITAVETFVRMRPFSAEHPPWITSFAVPNATYPPNVPVTLFHRNGVIRVHISISGWEGAGGMLGKGHVKKLHISTSLEVSGCSALRGSSEDILTKTVLHSGRDSQAVLQSATETIAPDLGTSCTREQVWIDDEELSIWLKVHSLL